MRRLPMARMQRGLWEVNKDGGTVTFEKAVGATGNALERITVSDGVAQFEANVFATGIAVTSTDGARFKGDVTTGTGGILFAENDEAKITLNDDDDQEVTGHIATDFDGRGLLVVNNTGTNKTVTFGGSIGTGGANGKALKGITLSAGATTFNGNLFARTIDINTTGDTTFKGHVSGATRFQFGANNSVTFNGTAAQTITGDITRTTGASAVNFTINNSEGVTFAGKLGGSGNDEALASVRVKEDAKVTFDAPVYLSGDLTAEKNSTITLGKAFGERTGAEADQPFLTVGGDFVLDSGVDETNTVTIAFDPSFRKGKQRLINKNLKSFADDKRLKFKGSYLIAYETNGTTVEAKGFNSKAEVAQTFKVSEEQATVFVAAAVARDALPDDSPLKKVFDDAESDTAKGKILIEQLAPQTTALSEGGDGGGEYRHTGCGCFF